MGIENDYFAYIFDEVAMFLEAKATDDEGKLNWNRVIWEDKEGKTNKDLIKFAQTNK